MGAQEHLIKDKVVDAGLDEEGNERVKREWIIVEWDEIEQLGQVTETGATSSGAAPPDKGALRRRLDEEITLRYLLNLFIEAPEYNDEDIMELFAVLIESGFEEDLRNELNEIRGLTVAPLEIEVDDTPRPA